MDVKVELLQNSGFNAENLPDSISLARSTNSISTQSIFLRSGNADYIEVDISALQARQSDYCILTENGSDYYAYFVTGFSFVANHNCRLYLDLDAVTTINCLSTAGPAIKGRLTRKNFSAAQMQDEERCTHLKLAEPWQPEHEFKMHFYNNIINGDGAIHNAWLVVSTVDLEKLEYKAKDYKDDKTSNFVTVPDLPVAPEASYFGIEGLSTWRIPFSSVYDGTDATVKASINMARSLGIDSAITASYIVPQNFIHESDMNGARIGTVKGVNNVVDSGVDINVGPKVENLKAKYLYQKITLHSISSGDKARFSLSQLGTDMSVRYFVDCHQDGHPFFRFNSILDNKSNIFYGAVKGSPWQKQAFSFGTHVSGEAVMQHHMNEDDMQQAVNGLVMPGAEMLAGAATGQGEITAKGVLDMANSAQSLRQKMQKQQETLKLNSPTVDFVQSDNLTNYLGNDVSVEQETLSDTDVKLFDNFLHNYGEACDEPLTKGDIHTRTDFNYIQASNIQIFTKMPRYIVNKAVAQLEGGVRVWHVLPNTDATVVGANLEVK